MTLNILLFFLLSLTPKPSVDLGLPTIQAICKVTLENGNIEEGIISFGGGGYDWHYTPHGFYHKFPKEQYVDLFNLEYSGQNFPAMKAQGAEIYYLENVTDVRWNNTIATVGDSLLTRTFEEKYRLHKKFPIYQELPEHLFVEHTKGLSNIIIDVDKIVAFDMLYEPSQKWLDLIETARKAQAKFEENAEDYLPPVWFHELIKDKEYRNYLMRYFP